MLSDAQKNAYANFDYRAKKSASNKKAWANPEVRKRMVEAMNTPESLARRSEARKKALANSDVRMKISENMKKVHADPEVEHRRSESLKKAWMNSSVRDKRIEGIKRSWKDPVLRNAHVNAIRESTCGDSNVNWRGGISFLPYCPKFNREFRERVRAFYGHKCFVCGKTQDENRAALSVHHVNYDKKACCEGEKVGGRLFVALCRQCHSKTNHGDRDEWELFFRNSIVLHTNGTMKTY